MSIYLEMLNNYVSRLNAADKVGSKLLNTEFKPKYVLYKGRTTNSDDIINHRVRLCLILAKMEGNETLSPVKVIYTLECTYVTSLLREADIPDGAAELMYENMATEFFKTDLGMKVFNNINTDLYNNLPIPS